MISKIIQPIGLSKSFKQIIKVTPLTQQNVMNFKPQMSFSLSKQEQTELFQSNFQSLDVDTANVLSSFSPVSEKLPTDIITKLSYITPSSIYEQLDQFSVQSLMYFSNELGLGMGWSIIVCSLLLKFTFLPIMISAQVNAAKMKLLDPEMKNFQSLTQKLQQTGDYNRMKEARSAFLQLREKHGISTWIPLAMLSQFPILITWFLSLRYITSVPDKFPGLRTDGILWIQDLSEQDPYFILPLLSASFSYLNIQNNPNMAGIGQGTIYGRYVKYFKFLPFLSMPVVAFFPSGLNFYWATLAFVHLNITMFMRTEFAKNLLGIPKYLPGSILEKMNQKTQQNVIKTTIINNNNIQNAAEAVAQQQLKQAQDEAKVHASKKQGSEKVVELFTQKPKKIKK